jgi:methionyl-tRNA formyltransferase
VKAAAEELGLPVTDDPDTLPEAGCDLGVVVAYGRIIKPHLLDRMAFVNLHVSLLPRWRGAAPIERAVLAGDERTGVCLMAVEEGLDTGGVYARTETEIDRKTVAELRSELIAAGTELLLDALSDGFGEPQPQVGEVTYAEKIAPDEQRIDWSATAEQVDRVVRLGGAWTTAGGRRLKVLGVEPLPGPSNQGGVPGTLDGTVVICGEGVVELREVQPEGKTPMDAAAWRRGSGAAVEQLGT